MNRCLADRDARLSPTTHGERERQRSRVRAAQRGDMAAREQLLEDFLPLVRSVARNYSRTAALDLEELVQEGVVGLFTALERYDPDLGPPFWANAAWWVRRMMQRLVADLALPMVLSDRALRQLATVKHVRHDLEQSHHSEPSSEEIASSTGYTHEQLDSLMCVELSPRSLDEPLKADDGAGGTLGGVARRPALRRRLSRRRPGARGRLPAPQTERPRHKGALGATCALRLRRPDRTLHEVGDELELKRRTRPADPGGRPREAAARLQQRTVGLHQVTRRSKPARARMGPA